MRLGNSLTRRLEGLERLLAPPPKGRTPSSSTVRTSPVRRPTRSGSRPSVSSMASSPTTSCSWCASRSWTA